MTHLLQDLRYGLRGLVRSPGFAIAAGLTLALGIGANTAMFSLVDAVLLRPLPYPQPERLVRVRAVNAETGQDANLNPLDFADYRRQARSFADLAAMATPTFSLTGGGEPERIRGARVSSNFFRAFGARPAIGRDFQIQDEQPDAEPVAILSHRLWERRYHSDPKILGKTVTLDDAPVIVIAILEDGFRAPGASEDDPPEVWTPLRIEERMGRGGHWLPVFGRLADGATIEKARAEMETLARSLEKEHPQSNQGWTTSLQDLEQSLVGNTRTPLLLLLASVGLVLLIACVNVANLLLARAGSREHEVAVRATLGASSARLLRQLLTESLLLATLGGAAGLLLAFFVTRLFSRLDPEILPRAEEIAVDSRVLAFNLGISVLAAIAFGLVPALRTARGAVLRQGTRTTPNRRLSAALVIAELALALVLLIGAGLLAKSFWRLLRVDLGFRAENLLIATVDLPASRYGEPHQMTAFYQSLFEKTAALPGVLHATGVDILPLSGGYSCNSFSIDDGSSIHAEDVPCIEYRIVGPGYFEALGIPIVQGESFPSTNAPVAIVNETLARALWPDRSPLGNRITLGFEEETPHTIVGVVKDVRHFGLQSAAAPEVYVNYLQHPTSALTVVVRTANDPASLRKSLAKEVQSLDPELPVSRVESLESLVAGSIAQPRLRTELLLLFALLALVLAAVGVFGVISYSVVRRTREIGLRMALGAGRTQVLRLVLGQTLAYAGAGLALGLAAALALTRLLASLLYEVGPTDPVIFITGAAVLLAVAGLAGYLPARQASRLEPLEALHEL